MPVQQLSKSWTVRAGLLAAMVVSTVGLTALPSTATEATSADAKIPLSITAKSFAFLGVPVFLRSGTYDLTFHNISADDDHEFIAVNLGPSCGSSIATVDDAKALLMSVGQQAHQAGADDPEPFFEAACPGGSFEGAAFAPPGGTDEEDLALTPGKTLYFCGVHEDDGTPHFDLGMIGFINVVDPSTRAGLPTGLDLLSAVSQPTGLQDLIGVFLPAGVSLPAWFGVPNLNDLLAGFGLPTGA